jgi:hypothetical protein
MDGMDEIEEEDESPEVIEGRRRDKMARDVLQSCYATRWPPPYLYLHEYPCRYLCEF